MRRITSASLACLLLFSTPAIAEAASSSIAPSGAKKPCTHTVSSDEAIQSVVRRALPGDVVCILPGMYHQAIWISASGRKDAPIIIRGEGGRPIIDGGYLLPKRNTLDFSGAKRGCPGSLPSIKNNGEPGPQMRFECTGWNALVSVSGSYVTIEGLEIVHSSGRGIGVGTRAPDHLEGVRLRNNFIHSVRLDGIELENVRHSVVEHNVVADSNNYAPFRRTTATANWGGGISAYAAHDVVIRNNVLHDNWGDALLVDTNTGLSSDITITDNVLFDNFSSNGIYAHAVKNVQIERNLVYCSANDSIFNWSSLLIAPSEPGFSEDIDTTGILVRDNIFSGCSNRGIVFWDTKKGVRQIDDVVVTNNTFYNNRGSISLPDVFSHGIRVSDNLIANSKTAPELFVRVPDVLTSGRVDPHWFRQKTYKGLGADVDKFGHAGLLFN